MLRTIAALALAMVLPLPVLAVEVTVKPGETLSDIAARYGVSVTRLMKVNRINDPDHVEIGSRLTIPGANGRAALPSARLSSVTVQKGETLSQIADRHAMTVAQLIKINAISDPDHVESGSRLKVIGTAKPTGSSGTAQGFSYKAGAGQHVVRQGESLSAIAEGYGVPISRLVALNQIDNPNHVEIGTRLRLKGSAPAPAPAVKPATKPVASVKRPAAAVAAAGPAPQVEAKPAVAMTDPTPLALARPTPTPQAAGRPVVPVEGSDLNRGAQPEPKPVVQAESQPTRQPAVALAKPVLPAARQAEPMANPSTGTGRSTAPAVATARADWRRYGPMQVEWTGWQPMGGSMVVPIINRKGESVYLAINCGARKMNASTPDGIWRTWEDPRADYENKLVNDLCRQKRL